MEAERALEGYVGAASDDAYRVLAARVGRLRRILAQ